MISNKLTYGIFLFYGCEFCIVSNELLCPLQLLPPGKDEDYIVNEKKLQKLERKKFSKDQEVLMDELLPKATGREALIEKKALRREQARARQDSPEIFRERDVMGGGDDFQKRCVTNLLTNSN